MKKSSIFHALSCALFSLSKTAFPFQHPEGKFKRHFAFSLVEMLMALLVASLLLAALAPVMTKRMNENIHITGEFSHNGRSVTEEIIFGGPYCNRITNDEGGNPLYCEGEYTVPQGFNNITAVAIGGGGGGGAAPNAGYMEFTTAGSTSEFKVPLMTNKIEATLISGGAGGGAGGQVLKTQSFVTSGNGGITNKTENDTITVNSSGTGNWSIPAAAKNSNIIASACCGGGGGGGSSSAFVATMVPGSFGYGGGSGGYIKDAVFGTGNISSLTYYIGGGGGGGRMPYSENICHFATSYGGGGGGHVCSAATGGGAAGEPYSNTQGPGDAELKTSNRTGGGGGLGYGDLTPFSLFSGGKGGQPGGGGGATAHYNSCVSGGGGGGGAASQIVAGSGILLSAAGGGGGACYMHNIQRNNCPAGTVAGGGGGGGDNGGNGGGLSKIPEADAEEVTEAMTNLVGKGGGSGSTRGADGNYSTGGVINSIFGTYYCSGGNGGVASSMASVASDFKSGYNGQSGAIRLTYLDYGPGGSGGGGASMVPIQPLSVSPNEVLNILIGAGAEGGTAGKIDSDGKTISAKNGAYGIETTIARRGTDILKTNIRGAYVAQPGCSGNIREYYCSAAGFMHDGKGILQGEANNLTVHGFTCASGLGSDNTNGSIGGDGGKLITPWFTCVPGKGGTLSKPKGGDGAGYGCGGGGGYGLSDGGRGSGGYARISWNMYWDTAANVYKSYTLGAGGGGASGNVIKETIRVQEGQVIKIRIGAGGIGAKVVNGEIIPATPGGTTIFGDTNFIEIKAGGGGGGMSPVVKDGILSKGEGGKPSNICSVGSRNYINNNKYCTKGTTGEVAADDSVNARIGGLGAPFSYTFNKKTYTGQGGGGGMQATEENNSKGKNAEGVASGGGGAALLTQNYVQNQSQLIYPQGGNGAHGRIILQLWE